MVSCGKYSASDLRVAVAIQFKTMASDGQGGFTATWSTVAGSPSRAMLTAAPGGERWGYMRQVPGGVYRMVTRWFNSATAAQRVVSGGREYAVLGVVDPDSGGAWLEWRLSDGVSS